jgi:hypothetical protein
MNSDRLSEIARVLEAGLGLKISSPGVPRTMAESLDFLCEAQLEGEVWPLAIEVKSSPGQMGPIKDRQETLRTKWPDLVPVLVVPRLSKKERERLRELGVNHLDYGGSIWIRHPRLFVDIEGDRRRPRLQGSRQERNPFSKRASLVSRVLLESPSETWGVRALSAKTSLSIGYTSEVLNTLVARDYARQTDDGFRLGNPASLLADWSAVYSWEDNSIRSYFVPFEKDELVLRVRDVLQEVNALPLLTLLAGLNQLDETADYVVHDQVHFYVNDYAYSIERKLLDELHGEPVTRGGNLHVLEPYYGPAVRFALNDQGSVAVVSDVQLFLDLVRFPVRGPESARMLLRRRMRQYLKLSEVEVETLEEKLGLR